MLARARSFPYNHYSLVCGAAEPVTFLDGTDLEFNLVLH